VSPGCKLVAAREVTVYPGDQDGVEKSQKLLEIMDDVPDCLRVGLVEQMDALWYCFRAPCVATQEYHQVMEALDCAPMQKDNCAPVVAAAIVGATLVGEPVGANKEGATEIPDDNSQKSGRA